MSVCFYLDMKVWSDPFERKKEWIASLDGQTKGERFSYLTLCFGTNYDHHQILISWIVLLNYFLCKNLCKIIYIYLEIILFPMILPCTKVATYHPSKPWKPVNTLKKDNPSKNTLKYPIHNHNPFPFSCKRVFLTTLSLMAIFFVFRRIST